MDSVSRGRWNVNVDPGAVHDHGWFGIVDEVVEEAQRLCIRAQRGQWLRLAGFFPFIWCQEIDPQPALGGVARHPSAVNDVRDRAKTLVDLLQNLQYRRGALAHFPRHTLEPGAVDRARL